MRIFRVSDIINVIVENRLLISDNYKTESKNSVWGIELLKSIENTTPIGTVQWKDNIDTFSQTYVMIDGLQRISAIFSILLGKGYYFDFEKDEITIDSSKYDYSSNVGSIELFYLENTVGLTTKQASMLSRKLRQTKESFLFVHIHEKEKPISEIYAGLQRSGIGKNEPNSLNFIPFLPILHAQISINSIFKACHS